MEVILYKILTQSKITVKQVFIFTIRALKAGVLGQPHGWSGEEGGRGVQDEGTYVYLWPIHVDVWQKSSKYCKVIILQLKLIKKNSHKEVS